MDKSNINRLSESDRALIENIGNFIKETRIRMGKTQAETAMAAGINRSTLSQIENGSGGTLLSIIQLLRVLGQLHMLQHFQAQPLVSPLKLAKIEQQKRQRASQPRTRPNDSKSNW